MLTIVEFDFEKKEERAVGPDRAKSAIQEGRFVWIDLDTTDIPAADRILQDLAILSDDVRIDVLSTEPQSRLNKFDDYLQLVLTSCDCTERGDLDLARVDVVVGKHFLLTAHDGDVPFMTEVRKHYHADFVRFAASPSFLLYELWDHLIEDYVAVQSKFEREVEKVQKQLMGEVDDTVFEHVGRLGGEILRFRNVLLPARSVLAELSTRKSAFISEATQPYLGNMVASIERVLADLVVDREVLSDRLNLYMSLVGHRTNRVMNRLTVVSIIFLPLTFLCGIYGMNFDVLPELHWKYGYLAFWAAVLAIGGGVYVVMRKLKLV